MAMLYAEKIINTLNNELSTCHVCRWNTHYDSHDAICRNCQKHVNESNTICFSLWEPKCVINDTAVYIFDTFTDEQKDFIYLIIGLCGYECEPGNAYKGTLDNILSFLKL